MEGTRCDNGIGAGGDGCADNFPGEDSMGFSVDPSNLATNHQPTEAITVRGASFYTIPDAVLDVLQQHTTLSQVGGGDVAVEPTWTNDLTWDQHEVLLSLAPVQPLAEGWYVLTIDGSLDTGHNTPAWLPESGTNEHKSVFRVGSAPIVMKIENCTDRVTIRLSELVTVPAILPIALLSNGQPLTCTQDLPASPGDADTIALSCPGLDTWQELRMDFFEGLASPSQVPLRNGDGDSAFTIMMAPSGTGGGCRVWEQDGIPSF